MLPHASSLMINSWHFIGLTTYQILFQVISILWLIFSSYKVNCYAHLLMGKLEHRDWVTCPKSHSLIKQSELGPEHMQAVPRICALSHCSASPLQWGCGNDFMIQVAPGHTSRVFEIKFRYLIAAYDCHKPFLWCVWPLDLIIFSCGIDVIKTWFLDDIWSGRKKHRA